MVTVGRWFSVRDATSVPKTAQRKLTSEERCRKAFEEQFPVVHANRYHPDTDGIWQGWVACWKYLEQRVTEFVES
jgi:hypothetical protein